MVRACFLVKDASLKLEAIAALLWLKPHETVAK